MKFEIIFFQPMKDRLQEVNPVMSSKLRNVFKESNLPSIPEEMREKYFHLRYFPLMTNLIRVSLFLFSLFCS